MTPDHLSLVRGGCGLGTSSTLGLGTSSTSLVPRPHPLRKLREEGVVWELKDYEYSRKITENTERRHVGVQANWTFYGEHKETLLLLKY